MDEAELVAMLRADGFSVAQLEYRLADEGKRAGYRMMIKTTKPENFGRLAAKLRDDRNIDEFRVSPTGD
jgi:hypothetical protein